MEIYCVVSGDVQRVGFRAYVEDASTKLALVGWVRNLPDGSVEVVAQGEPDILKEFVEHLHEGSLRSRVEAVSVDWRTVRMPLYEFSVKH